MDKVINLKLMAHPMNWLIVWLVITFACFAWAIIHEHVSGATIAGAVDNAA